MRVELERGRVEVVGARPGGRARLPHPVERERPDGSGRREPPDQVAVALELLVVLDGRVRRPRARLAVAASGVLVHRIRAHPDLPPPDPLAVGGLCPHQHGVHVDASVHKDAVRAVLRRRARAVPGGRELLEVTAVRERVDVEAGIELAGREPERWHRRRSGRQRGYPFAVIAFVTHIAVAGVGVILRLAVDGRAVRATVPAVGAILCAVCVAGSYRVQVKVGCLDR